MFYITQRLGGAGSSYRHIPITTAAAASGVTAIAGQSNMIAVRNGDVLTVYLDGLARHDHAGPSVRWFELDGMVLAATQGRCGIERQCRHGDGALIVTNANVTGYGVRDKWACTTAINQGTGLALAGMRGVTVAIQNRERTNDRTDQSHCQRQRRRFASGQLQHKRL